MKKSVMKIVGILDVGVEVDASVVDVRVAWGVVERAAGDAVVDACVFVVVGSSNDEFAVDNNRY